jgi:hypothetical protein
VAVLREGGTGALIATPAAARPVLVALASPVAGEWRSVMPVPARPARTPRADGWAETAGSRGRPAAGEGGRDGAPGTRPPSDPGRPAGTIGARDRADSTDVDASGGGVRAPQFASGRLWDRPLPSLPAGAAARHARTHPELIDSAVTAMMATWLDSLARESGFEAAPRPDWTVQVAGRTFGLVGPYVVIAGLKLPSALLGLLPVDGGPSPDQAKRAQQLLDMRDEIWRAAARAESYGDFRRAVRELRTRTEEQRAFQRAQREPMPPLAADTAAGGAQ